MALKIKWPGRLSMCLHHIYTVKMKECDNGSFRNYFYTRRGHNKLKAKGTIPLAAYISCNILISVPEYQMSADLSSL